MTVRDQPIAAMAVGCFLVGSMAWHARAAQAMPPTHVPTDPHTVVHRLPAPVPLQERQRWASSRNRSNAAPNAHTNTAANAREALVIARQAIERSRLTGHPSDLGQAAAALAAWQGDANAPREIRLMRSIVHQRQHRFDDAMKDLDGLLLDDPRLDPSTSDAVTMQALLTRASLHRLQGRWFKVKQDCERLGVLARESSLPDVVMLAAACLAEVLTFTGKWQDGQAALQRLAARAPQNAHVQQVQAELGLRLGATPKTLAKLEQLAKLGSDVYSRTAYLDALLDSGQEMQALKAWTSWRVRGPGDQPHAIDASDPWLIQRAIIAKRLAQPEAPVLAHLLQARQHTTLLREESLDARDAARVALDVLALPQQALAHAQANWDQQREPIDALLVVRAAVAAQRQDEAKRFIEQLRAEGWHDVRLWQVLKTSRKP
jgi:tetratricopeptide (TPR) repeat protein